MVQRIAGFTLIELLVVVAIVGLLSSVVLASIDSARENARDARRKADLRQIQSALELYYGDNGSYPVGSAGSDRSCWINQEGQSGCHPLGGLTDGGYMQSVPVDPAANTYVGSGCGGAQFYSYWSNGQEYLLGAVEETEGGSGCTQDGNWSGPNATNYTYQYYIRQGV